MQTPSVTISSILLEKLKKLSPTQQQQIEDYIDFIIQKYGKDSEESRSNQMVGVAVSPHLLNNSVKTDNIQKPHPDLAGQVQIKGEIFDSIPEQDWEILKG